MKCFPKYVSFLAFCSILFINFQESGYTQTVERWGLLEVSLTGPSEGNPFLDVSLKAKFTQGERSFEPEGFYDGKGVFKVRFMPDSLGTWTYETTSNLPDLDGKSGEFECVQPSGDNHGPVKVADRYRLEYADGTPHFSIGTTCYAWTHQGEELEEQTLKTLAASPFNKMRMCVFPKHYSYNRNEPPHYPFPRDEEGENDFTRFNPDFFRHFEKRVTDLMDMGIEADIILLHPYDRWGYEKMEVEEASRYLRYVVARLAAFRNVWWSMANEYDLMENYVESDWDHFFQVVRDADPYGKLRSIHNCVRNYDHTKPWVTHVSLQSSNLDRALEYREEYGKPLLFDECKYEGDVPQGWGNIGPHRMLYNFWAGSLSGCYVGHGETYMHPEDILWWSKGGVLHGESPERIAFLKQFFENLPYQEMAPDPEVSPGNYVYSKPNEIYLVLLDSTKVSNIDLPGSRPYKVDEIDTWNMEVRPLGNAQPGGYRIAPRYPNYVVRLTPYSTGEAVRPDAVAKVDSSEGVAPHQVQFQGSGGVEYHWEFGDGSTSKKPSPTHTYSGHGVFTPVLTVTDDQGLSSTTALSIRVFPQPPNDLETASSWPGSREGLVFLWENEDGAFTEGLELEKRDGAVIENSGPMKLGKGSVIIEGIADRLLSACRDSNQLTIEAVLNTPNKNQKGPARIITFSQDHGSRNFTLGQNGNKIVLRLRTSENSGNASDPQITLCKIEPDKPIHLIVSYFPGQMNVYVNGERVKSTADLGGDFSTWGEDHHFLFGDEWVGDRSWEGTLDHVAIYSRYVAEEEASKVYELFQLE